MPLPSAECGEKTLARCACVPHLKSVNENLLMGLTYLAVAVVLIGLNLPLAWRKVPRNRWYGFRLGIAMKDDAAWYRINAYGARRLIAWCVLLGLIGAVSAVYALEGGEALLCWCLPWMPLVLLIPCLQAWLFAMKVSRELSQEPDTTSARPFRR